MRQEVGHFVNNGDGTVHKLMKDIHRLLEVGEPLPKMPIIRPLQAPRFRAHQKDRWLRHLADEGFVVIANVAGQAEIERAYSLLWKFIEDSDASGNIRCEDVSTWEDNRGEEGRGWPAGREDGILHSRGIGQSELLWYLRSLPALKQVFADIWGTDQLVCSFDGAGVFRPYGNNHSWKTSKTNWFHVDQAHLKRGLHCVQGLLTLKEATPATGGFVVVPGSHRFHNDVLKNYRATKSGWNYISLRPNDPVLCEGDNGPRMVCACAGDLLLWDSRTVHCNTLPLQEDKALLNGADLIRAVAYMCMTPAAWCQAETVAQREHAFRRGVTTSHWPHEFHAMNVQRLGSSYFTLTEEQQALVYPEAPSDGKKKKKDTAPKEGMVSVLPTRRFEVTAPKGVNVLEAATTEWGDQAMGQLDKSTVIEGHVIGKWLRLAEFPRNGKLKGLGEDEDAWVAADWQSLREIDIVVRK